VVTAGGRAAPALGLICLAALALEGALPRPATVELALDVGRLDPDSGGHAIHDDAHRRPVGLPERRDDEELADGR